jgi:hypothetical protein
MSSLASLVSDLGVSGADLDKARAYQQKYGGRLEQILVNMGSLSADSLPEIYGRLLQAQVLPARYAAGWEPPAGLEELPVDFLLERGCRSSARKADGCLPRMRRSTSRSTNGSAPRPFPTNFGW